MLVTIPIEIINLINYQEAVLFTPSRPMLAPTLIPFTTLRAQVEMFRIDARPLSPEAASPTNDNMDAAAVKCIKHDSQCRNESFALASFHLCNLTTVQSNTPHQLYIKVALPQGALGGFSD